MVAMKRWRLLPFLLLIVALSSLTGGRAAAACTFQLGFAALGAMIPQQVGVCQEDEGHNPANGDGLQHTSGGLLVWRKADNWTAFTDGYRTWINGPSGLVERLNTQRFPWDADFHGDPRFGVFLTSALPDGGVHALDALHVQWFIGAAPPSLAYAPTHILDTLGLPLATVASLAQRYPGRAWSLGLEPNGYAMNDPQTQPAAYARRLHDIATTLHAADLTALLIGPDILNWSADCAGCIGMPTGQAWTEALRSAYLADFGEELPFDVWAIHTYPLDWQHLPTVNYALMEQQLVQFRQYLDSIPAERGKPIWDTELGVHWGYTAYQFQNIDGTKVLLPAGVLRQDLVIDYFQHMLNWLTQNGAQYNITRWFVYSTYNPDVPGDHAGAITLLDGPGSAAGLTVFGRMYADAAMGSAP